VATGVGIAPLIAAPVEDTPEFRVDDPFIILIPDNDTGNVPETGNDAGNILLHGKYGQGEAVP